MDSEREKKVEPVSPDEPLASTRDVREALKDVATSDDPGVRNRPAKSHWIWIDLFLGLVFLAGYVALRLDVFPLARHWLAAAQRLMVGLAAGAGVLMVQRILDAYVLCPLDDAALRYNARRIARFVVGIVLVIIALSAIFANWYAAVASLGMASVIIGLALQTPVMSFIGWIYILSKHPYRVGDRIMINGAIGDVIDVAYLDTTLWEVGGQNLSADHPSGRIIKFPNANVLQAAVYNYSWPLFPYVWNEITFHVAYQSDLQFIADTMQHAVEEEMGEQMMSRARAFREILARTPVDNVNVRDRPSVNFRVDGNTWLDATVRYIVPPKQAGPVKTRLIRTMLERLNAHPDKVMFPAGNNR